MFQPKVDHRNDITKNQINMQWHLLHQWCPKLAKYSGLILCKWPVWLSFFEIMDTFHKASTSSDTFNDVWAKGWPQKLTYTNKINMQWHLLHQWCPKLAKIQDSFCVNDLCNCLFLKLGSHFTKHPLPVTDFLMMFEPKVDHRNDLTQKNQHAVASNSSVMSQISKDSGLILCKWPV